MRFDIGQSILFLMTFVEKTASFRHSLLKTVRFEFLSVRSEEERDWPVVADGWSGEW